MLSGIPRDRRRVYKTREILDAVLDDGSFFEMGRMYGRSVITGLARLDGWPVAILASDPYHYGGGWTADAAHKIARSEEHTSELQSLMRISYAVFCLKKKKNKINNTTINHHKIR